MSSLSALFELPRPGTLRPMEGLRGFAVALVFLTHYATLIMPWLAPGTAVAGIAEALHAIGNCGVDLFFVLSGYLIYGALIGRAQPFSRFMLRRIERIYPVYGVVFLAYLALSWAVPAESKIPAGSISGACYVLGNFLLLNGFDRAPTMITAAWSLSYEMLYYLTLPWLIAAARMRERSGAWRARFCVMLLVAALAGFAAFGGPVRLLMFGAGILLFETLNGARPLVFAVPAWRVFLALAAGLAIMLVHGQPVLKTLVLCGVFFLLCLSCFGAPGDLPARLFSWTPLRWLGNISYSFYLIHGLALKAGFKLLAAVVPPSPHGASVSFLLAWLLPMLALALLASVPLFLLVERPLSLAPKKPAIAAASPL
jgi:exopolysaccharide production protein ExoZ